MNYFTIILLTVPCLFGLAYALVIQYVLNGWKNSEILTIKDDNFLCFSVIIAVKNESAFIGQCIQSLLNNDYPISKFEIIIVNDHSSDNTQTIIDSFTDPRIRAIHLTSHHGKKSALTIGITHAQYEHIAVTDGDCLCPPNWLQAWSAAFQTKSDCITGLVKCNADFSYIEQWQLMDTAATMAVTANGILRKHYFLANGANMAFTKSLFTKIGGYSNNGHIASGDDVFLINEAIKHNAKVTFLKSVESIVQTSALSNVNTLLQQRKRWASKTLYYANHYLLFVQATVFGVCLTIVLWPFIALINLNAMYAGFSLFLIKMMIDYFFLKEVLAYFNEKMKIFTFIKCSFFYLMMMLYMGWQSLWPSNYNWKGREYSTKQKSL